ncbi:ImmA/IrrE family metallo-endopeptidase [Delftia sp. WY8]|uniref:ImmA/IrrE family metallo-endopeptidase n=1 Tax=Delftia sp. WY8 TaxID=2708352 RepID=UPI0020219F8C|nr:ImmA/IrrE family metallo-endopeptidase [Delftia sp. WY8]
MEAKIIRTEDQYHQYLAEIQMLMANAPSLGTIDSDRLELLSVLIESYERNKYPVELPDPIDAILFRMREKGLRQTDLVQYLGTKSRVSEILSRKRSLTVQMIRDLSVGLGISTETLVGINSSTAEEIKSDMEWEKFPLKEINQRGWLNSAMKKGADSVEKAVKGFIEEAGLNFGAAAFRRRISGEATTPTTKYSLYAWLARAVILARRRKVSLGPFSKDQLSADFLRDVAQLSWFDKGPLLAIEYLEKHGIAVVIEDHLKGTHLDGAALLDSDGTPIIAITLRHDRLDNFWFTLLHELAHIWKHVGVDEAFLDDLDSESEDKREAEANRLAREAFIPRALWRRSNAFISPNRQNIEQLAKELRIHPAIIAGRIRRESGNYSLFSELVGRDEVRNLLRDLKTCEV